jgi:hypothetical protein
MSVEIMSALAHLLDNILSLLPRLGVLGLSAEGRVDMAAMRIDQIPGTERKVAIDRFMAVTGKLFESVADKVLSTYIYPLIDKEFVPFSLLDHNTNTLILVLIEASSLYNYVRCSRRQGGRSQHACSIVEVSEKTLPKQNRCVISQCLIKTLELCCFGSRGFAYCKFYLRGTDGKESRNARHGFAVKKR